MNLDFKQRVHQACLALVEEKILTIQNEYKLYQESAANETKSTAGDKHDTGKAMMQMEQEKLGIQFKELVNNKKILGSLNPAHHLESIQFGSLIKTNHGTFYLSISLGKISIDSAEIYIISNQSPLSKLMLNKVINATFVFNERKYEILEVY